MNTDQRCPQCGKIHADGQGQLFAKRQVIDIPIIQASIIEHQVFNFLFHHDVPYEKNGSERSIRNIKVKQKVSGSFRSERGAEIFAILRSVFETTIKKGGNPFETIRFAINIAANKNEFLANRAG